MSMFHACALGGTIYASHGKNDARGTMIAFKKNHPFEIIAKDCDKEGRISIVQFKHREQLYLIWSCIHRLDKNFVHRFDCVYH